MRVWNHVDSLTLLKMAESMERHDGPVLLRPDLSKTPSMTVAKVASDAEVLRVKLASSDQAGRELARNSTGYHNELKEFFHRVLTP